MMQQWCRRKLVTFASLRQRRWITGKGQKEEEEEVNGLRQAPLWTETLRAESPPPSVFGVASRDGTDAWKRSNAWHEFAAFPDRSAAARFVRPPPVPPPPELQRQWVCSDDASLQSLDKFTFASYNILSAEHGYSKRRLLFSYAQPHELDWKFRKRNIIAEMSFWSPDIICLQEVDKFEELQQEMASRGYGGFYQKRTGHETDGCAIFWNRERFKLLEMENIQFEDIGMRNNVAQLCVLESTQKTMPDGSGQAASSRESANSSMFRVIVGNIHILFNPRRGDVKLGQVRAFLERADTLSCAWNKAPIVIGGDFNSTPTSAVYKFLATSELDLSSIDRRFLSGQEDPQVQIPFNRTRQYLETLAGANSVNENLLEDSAMVSDISLSANGFAESPAKLCQGTDILSGATGVEEREPKMEINRDSRDGLESGMISENRLPDSQTQSVGQKTCGGDLFERPEKFGILDEVLAPLATASNVRPSREWGSNELRVATGDPSSKVLKHNLNLQSAYAQIQGKKSTRGDQGEPLATCYNARFRGTTDYIWLSKGLKPIKVLDTVLPSEMDQIQGFLSNGDPFVPILRSQLLIEAAGSHSDQVQWIWEDRADVPEDMAAFFRHPPVG